MGYNLPSTVYLPSELDSKATNIHARMAVYFDNNIYKENRNDTLLYQYLYHIIMMLAKKAKYFVSYEEYDAFSHYMATKLYLRYINPEHTEKHGKIKSVLNYCKALLHTSKIDFQRDTFNEIIGVNNKGENDGSGDVLNNIITDSIQESYCKDNHLEEALLEEIKELPKLLTKVMEETPYSHSSQLYHRLYMSTYLTTVSSMTLSNNAIRKMTNRTTKGYDNDKLLLDLYNKEFNDCILWRLDNTYYNLVSVLSKKVKKLFIQALLSVRHDLELSQEDLNAVLMSAYGNTLRDNNEEF